MGLFYHNLSDNAISKVYFVFAFLKRVGYNICMTIHHDKLAYGKLEPNMQELSEEDILKMLETLNGEEEEESTEKSSENNSDK